MKPLNLLKNDISIDLLGRNSSFKILLYSFIGAIFVVYPNIAIFSLESDFLGDSKHTALLLFFSFRYLYFSGLIWILLQYNLRKTGVSTLRSRLVKALLITIAAYLIYIAFSILLSPKKEWYSGLLIFQFFVMFVFSSLIGHVSNLYSEQRRKENEIEQLRIDNLQSQYTALTNQINPHFFFNSLNGLTSIIRKKNQEAALEYINKLSDVFRYILRSDKKGLVTLGEELEFLKAFLYMLEFRFANKLIFSVSIPEEKRNLSLPALSLLPLIENVVVHNTIDSEHHMIVDIGLNEKMELYVSNPIYPKISDPDTNGIGLNNLKNRFLLLMNNQIRIKNDGMKFTVYLPLKREGNEDIDS